MSTTPSGWYPNPHNAAEELYWDGARWLGASRVRIVESAVAAVPSGIEDATVMRPAGGAWPAPTTYEPASGGYEPSWDTVPLTVDGQPMIGFAALGFSQAEPAPTGRGVPYPTPGYASYAAAPPPYAVSGNGQPGFAPPGYVPSGASPYPNAYGLPRPDALRANGLALASLLLGIGGLVLTAVPFLIGLVAGGIPDLLAVVFGVLGIVRSRAIGGAGLVFAVVGTVLGALGLCLIPLGAGWLW